MDALSLQSEPNTASSWDLFDSVETGVAVTTADGTLEFCNTALLRLLAESPDALLGSSIFKLLEGGANDALEKLHRTALAARTDLRTQVRSGTGRFVAATVLRRLTRHDGDRVIWSFLDARRDGPAPELAHHSANALERSESRLAHAVWGMSVGFWNHDVATDTVHWWNDWCASVDLDPCEGPRHNVRWDGYVHSDDLEPFSRSYQRLLDGRCELYESEYRIRTRSGSWRWVMSRGRAMARDGSGRAIRLAGVTIDIDARKRMELALRDSEARLRTQAIILETMREGVVLVSLDGRIEFTNPAFDRMFGRGSKELTGISIMEMFNFRQAQSPAAVLEVLLERHSRGARRDMLFRRRDGSHFAGEVLSAEIEVSGEKRILIVVQDVSERKHLESEIIEIASRERRRLGADLHDGLGQELTGISLMLRGFAKRAGVAALDVAPDLDEVITLVNHAIQSARKMAQGISPVTLERGGLLPALQTLISWSRDSYDVAIQLRLAVRSPLLIGESVAAHLYLIVQESINNAVRHGRARSIAVTLRANRTLVSLSISDDGVGIAEKPGRGGGMGLKVMEYRSAVIGGVLGIKRRPGGGTRVHSVCPQNAGAARFNS
jgi:PAS domain S-box-containing protein